MFNVACPSTGDPFAFAGRERWVDALLDADIPSAAACALFGERECRILKRLVAHARRQPLRTRDCVLLLPGMMGSALGHRGSEPREWCDDVLWLDPVEIALGNLPALALRPGVPAIEVLGVLPFVYWRLRWRLRARGIEVDFHPFDWRRDLGTLGRELAARIQAAPSTRVHLIGHSLGGLVARSALRHLQNLIGSDSRMGRVVLVGTPNHGALAALEALRGTLDTVRTLARFDPFHSAEELSDTVFGTFPSLCELLPGPLDGADSLDLFDVDAWPTAGPRPDPGLLRAARDALGQLPAPDARFHIIAGTGQPTATRVRCVSDEFVYDLCDAGDDTVSLASVRWSGVSTHVVPAAHGKLPQRRDVADAIADLILTGQTHALPHLDSPPDPMKKRTLTETRLRTLIPAAKRGRIPTPEETRRLAARFAAPAESTAHASEQRRVRGVSELGSRASTARRRLRVCVARGHLAQVSSRALLLGVFRGVVPDGPAAALDVRLGGAIRELAVRRMFHANLGEVFLLPTAGHAVQAEFLLLVGLGTFDRFGADSLATAAETALRIALRAGADTLATALVGARSGLDTATLSRALLRGFLRALIDADPQQRFRQLTFCEIDPVRCARVVSHLRGLARTPGFADVDWVIRERVLPRPTPIGVPAPAATPPPSSPAPVYLILRDESTTPGTARFRAAVLTSGPKATVITAERRMRRRRLDDLVRDVAGEGLTPDQLIAQGEQLTNLLLADEIQAVLTAFRDRHVVIVHDAPASRVPWEILRLAFGAPALHGGLSRRYLADDLSAARWLEARRQNATLGILLVINPTADLDGAEAEGERLTTLLGAHPTVRITHRRHRQATRDSLRADFHSGRFDVVHYAGHAFFDPTDPSSSGLYCAGGELLTGRDLAGLQNLPHLVFFNACESGRLRRGKRPRSGRLETAVGLAEAFLRGGVANYVGTYWPVGDLAALAFASAFYGAVLRGEPLGPAVLAARQAVHALPEPSVDWADYLHYGTPDFVLKLPADPAAPVPYARP